MIICKDRLGRDLSLCLFDNGNEDLASVRVGGHEHSCHPFESMIGWAGRYDPPYNFHYYTRVCNKDYRINPNDFSSALETMAAWDCENHCVKQDVLKEVIDRFDPKA